VKIPGPDKVRVLIAATTKRLFDGHVDILRELEPGSWIWNR
jgi:hypothetical protein